MSWIPIKNLKEYHNIDRVAYARLLYPYGSDCVAYKKIIALWNWLETQGYRNFVSHTLTVSGAVLYCLEMESKLCLQCLNELKLKFLQELSLQFVDEKNKESGESGCDNRLPVMSQLCGKELSLEFIYENKESAKATITKFVRDVCDRAFTDIVPRECLIDEIQFMESTFGLLRPQVNILGQQGNEQVDEEVANGDFCNGEQRISDRSLFVTFSKDQSITRELLHCFFNWRYGDDCVEEITMDDNDSGREECADARVVVRLPSYIARILGENEVTQINCDPLFRLTVRKFA